MEDTHSKRLSGVIKKNWGYELIWATNDQYCGKILVFEKSGDNFGMMFHQKKDKSWFVNNGKFLVRWIDTNTGIVYSKELKEGDVWRILPLQPHQLEALEDNSSIAEVSTADSIEDSYRISVDNN